MSNNNDIPTCPVAGWTIQTVAPYDAVTIQLDFLTHITQKLDEANKSPTYILHAAQALELAEKIQTAVQKLKSAGAQIPPGDRH